MRFIELLSPARDLQCGIEAVRHGADAVYIGASRFGARAAAGNSVEDIARLVEFAHPFGVRIYVTLNTLLHDDELPAAQQLISELSAAHIDALIVQDPRISSLNSQQPIPLHASTQMNNRTPEQAVELVCQGYEQIVLARELSLQQIAEIHRAVPDTPLEAFIHGALCVSYSGRCYASEYCFGRSANRGECAQFCRLPFDLVNERGDVLIHDRHLLSLRDLNRSADLEAMMDAGVSSFKIEGRLKDVTYVKNTTAYYRQRIDEIISRRSDEYCRSSVGKSTFTFTPDVQRSFNRGFTDYFLHGRTSDLVEFRTPKSTGQPVGELIRSDRRAVTVRCPSTIELTAGDGLCFFDTTDHLQGFRINRILTQRPFGNDSKEYLIEAEMTAAAPHRARLFRNQDNAFEQVLRRPSADRRIDVSWRLSSTDQGFELSITDETGLCISRQFEYPHEAAKTPQHDAIVRQLNRLGDTIFRTTHVDVACSSFFIPASTLAAWRRELCDELLAKRSNTINVSHNNDIASNIDSPSEVGCERALMTCRYCLRHALGQCLREGGKPEALSLRLADGRTFPLHFDCSKCEMQVLAPQNR